MNSDHQPEIDFTLFPHTKICVKHLHSERMSHKYESKVFDTPRCFDTPNESLFDGDTERIDQEYRHRARRRDGLTQLDYGDIPEIRIIKEDIAMRNELPPIKWKKLTILNPDGTQTVYPLKGELPRGNNGNTSRAKAQSKW